MEASDNSGSSARGPDPQSECENAVGYAAASRLANRSADATRGFLRGWV